MKKWIAGILVAVVLLLVSLYVLIPNIVSLKANIAIKATRPGINRMLLDQKSVAKWWPGKIVGDSFLLNDFAYKIDNGNITAMPVTISGHNNIIPSSLFLVSITTDSTHLEWVCGMVTSYSPLKRWEAYQIAKNLNRDMTAILEKMQSFHTNPQNIYGIKINLELVADSLLIATAGNSTDYPTNVYIYSLIDKLRTYATANGAKESGYPMLNVSTSDSISYEVKVAIPTDKLLPGSGDILQKRMLARGNILVAEVTGGIGITKRAIDEVKNYAEDHQRVAPAIPFYSLITDRLKETDSSKWVTKIYFPVM